MNRDTIYLVVTPPERMQGGIDVWYYDVLEHLEANDNNEFNDKALTLYEMYDQGESREAIYEALDIPEEVIIKIEKRHTMDILAALVPLFGKKVSTPK